MGRITNSRSNALGSRTSTERSSCGRVRLQSKAWRKCRRRIASKAPSRTYSLMTGLIRLAACIAVMSCALGLQAQTYPSRPIRLIVPVAPHMFANPKIDPGKDFAAIAPIMSSPLTVIARPTLPVNSIADLVELARSKPGALNYGAAGVGTHVYLVGELFKKQAGFDAVYVPFQGGAPTMAALLAGNIDYKFDVVNTTLPQARAGKVKVLAVTSARRIALMPGVPTLAESGFPGIEATAWVGVVGPAGLPAGIVSRLNAEIGNAVSARDLSEVYVAQGVVPELASPAEFADMIKSEYARWGAVVRQVGPKPE